MGTYNEESASAENVIFKEDYELAQMVLARSPKWDKAFAAYLKNKCIPVFERLAKKIWVLRLEAPEVMSETVIHLIEHDCSALKAYRGDMPLSAFIYTMVRRRLSKDGERRTKKDGIEPSAHRDVVSPELEKAKWRALSDGSRQVSWDDFIPMGKDADSASYSFDFWKVQLYDALALLKVDVQKIVKARVIDGLSADEVAEKYNMTRMQVYRIYNQAKEDLRALLEDRVGNVVPATRGVQNKCQKAPVKNESNRAKISESHDVARMVLSAFSENEKKLLGYRYKKKMSYEEIGAKMNMSLNDVRRILDAAEKKGQKVLDDYRKGK